MTETMSQTDQTRAVVERLYAAGTTGDVEGVLATLADNVVVSEPSFLPWGGTYTGHDQFLALFGDLAQKLDLSKLAIEYAVTENDKCFTVFRVPGIDSGKDAFITEQSTVRDGKIVEMTVFYNEQP
ncbi:nuclear transport factor 2 family protein [Rhodococcus koreensis]|uniref:nuclear transport factor 2 family protein n=1 Tax=Rhodococcus koreensis TaxID=99653 RepID=UPI00366D7CD6